jgi:histidine ammonia-lyase
LKSKEGLALVNGTSAMAGLALANLNHISFLYETSVLCTAWLCLVLRGRTEAYDVLVNQKAKSFSGQTKTAMTVKKLIDDEGYKAKCSSDVIQDPYSMRCTPQILGPVYDTIELFGSWLDHEINGVSDNPLIDDNGDIANGGNFYGGYISHGMDYLKICLGHIADQMDRQLTLLISDKTNRGLTPNLINWPDNNDEHHLHHGLKGLHQLTSAITSEIIAKTMPNGVLSRSSESHNQDKVSLGMSAACQCAEAIDKAYNLFSAYLICLAQAVDLREIKLEGKTSKEMYAKIRACASFIDKDTRLDGALQKLSVELKQLARTRGN